MTGGTIDVEGSVGDWAGAALGGGLLRIKGNAGNFLGAAYPGSRIGMREGVILVEGNVGDDAGLAMRRGLIAIAGAAGDGLGRGMIAGSIFAFGPVGRRAGAGMKRGTLAFYGLPDPARPDLLPTFAAERAIAPALPDDLPAGGSRQWGFPVPETAFSGPLDRYNGDLGDQGPGRNPDRDRVVIRRLPPARPTRTCDEPESTGAPGGRLAPRVRRGMQGGRPSDRARAGGSSTAGSRSAGVCSRASSWRGSAWPTWPTSRSCRARSADASCPLVQVVTDHPVQACLASQYAGWAISEEKYFAMGSGPMRGGRGTRGDLRDDRLSRGERVGRRRARDAQAADTRGGRQDRRGLSRSLPSAVTLLVAPTASLAGGLQIVARSVETALHKLAELRFDLSRIVSAHGTAPLPPVAANDLAAIGRTNDAILYGARVVLCVTGDDDSLRAIGPQVPSSVLARLRRAVRRDLRALQSRLLRRRSAPLQPGRGRLPEPGDRPRPCLRRAGRGRARPLVLLLTPWSCSDSVSIP